MVEQEAFCDSGSSVVVCAGFAVVCVDGRGSIGSELVFEGGIGESDVMAKSVSAATIPPIECPINMVCTDGSTVGEGVDAATSRSMTLF